MGVTDWASPATVADGGGGSWPWVSYPSAAAQDDVYATAGSSMIAALSDADTNDLELTEFGIEIPDGSTITGIEVRADHYGTGTNRPRWTCCRLIVGGSVCATDRSDGAALASADADAYVTAGGSADLWGEAGLSVDDVEDDGFGCVLAYTVPANEANCRARVDHVQMRAHYTESGGETGPSAGQMAIAVV